jgi:ABC-2 type transport system ATP-binding protein
MGTTPTVTTGQGRPRADVSAGLHVGALRRRFGDVQALDGVSLHVRPGNVHGFVGANGADKTTTMRIVVGVARADTGTVHVNGAAITPEVRARIGYLPEERGLYPDMRVLDQVVFLARLHGLAAATAHRRSEALLDRLGLTPRLHDPTGELSLGNQQRVQLAAAIVHEPDVLVLDEPFSGLDPVASGVMASLVAEQAARGVPVLFSSHQLDLVERLCDHVTGIADGRLVADGSIPDSGPPAPIDGFGSWPTASTPCGAAGRGTPDGITLRRPTVARRP